MKSVSRVAAAASLACLLAMGGCGGCRDNKPGRAGKNPAAEAASGIEPPAAEDAGEPAPVPPTPDVALEVNSATEATVHAGTPMVFTVRLGNQRAANVLSAQAAGAGSDKDRPVPVVKLGAGWPKSVQLNVRDSAGRSMTWPLSFLGRQEPPAVALDGRTATEAKWGISPEAAAKIAPGVYQIKAALEVAGRAGGWDGRAESEPVTLIIQARPPDLRGVEAEKSLLDLARYWAQAKDWDKSLDAARRAAAENPESIEAHTLAGDAFSGRNDADSALAEYRKALELYRRQNLEKEYGQPDYLINRISRLAKADLEKKK